MRGNGTGTRAGTSHAHVVVLPHVVEFVLEVRGEALVLLVMQVASDHQLALVVHADPCLVGVRGGVRVGLERVRFPVLLAGVEP